MKLRTIAVVGALGVAGLALIGAGASATFTQNTTSSQKITAGSISVVLSAPDAEGNNTPSITCRTSGRWFDVTTPPTLVTITNNGNIAVSEVAIQLTDTNNNATLRSDTWVCIYSDGNFFAAEPLTTVEGYGSAEVAGGIAPEVPTLIPWSSTQGITPTAVGPHIRASRRRLRLGQDLR